MPEQVWPNFFRSVWVNAMGGNCVPSQNIIGTVAGEGLAASVLENGFSTGVCFFQPRPLPRPNDPQSFGRYP
jgi:hypothetical protein